MSIIWLIMVISACVLLIFKEPTMVIGSMLSASTNAVSFCINLLGIYAVWLGIINVLDKSGFSDKLAKILSPIIKILFKSKNEKANKYIAINLSSNILGLGNAATPSGIKAMQELDDNSGKITFAGIMLLVINSVSIQLLPTTIISLRESAKSASASDIILPTIISSMLTCAFAIILVFVFNKIKNIFFTRKKCNNGDFTNKTQNNHNHKLNSNDTKNILSIKNQQKKERIKNERENTK